MKRKSAFLCAVVLTASILCSCGGGGGKISVKEDTLRMKIDDRYTVKVANSEKKDLRWSSGNESVAVVSPDGTVSAVGNGITTVTARYEEQYVHVGVIVGGNNEYTDSDGNVVLVFDGESDITEITVGVSGGGKGDITVKTGDKFQLRAYTVPSNSKDKIIWQTDNSSVVKVNEKGVMQAVGKGKATVSAYAPNGVKGTLIVRCG